jgi:hypothetical protein
MLRTALLALCDCVYCKVNNINTPACTHPAMRSTRRTNQTIPCSCGPHLATKQATNKRQYTPYKKVSKRSKEHLPVVCCLQAPLVQPAAA